MWEANFNHLIDLVQSSVWVGRYCGHDTLFKTISKNYSLWETAPLGVTYSFQQKHWLIIYWFRGLVTRWWFLSISNTWWDGVLVLWLKKPKACIQVCLFVCLFVGVYVCKFLCLYMSLSVCVTVSMFLCLYVSLFVSFSVWMFLCLDVSLFVSMFVWLFVCLSLPC